MLSLREVTAAVIAVSLAACGGSQVLNGTNVSNFAAPDRAQIPSCKGEVVHGAGGVRCRQPLGRPWRELHDRVFDQVRRDDPRDRIRPRKRAHGGGLVRSHQHSSRKTRHEEVLMGL